MISHVTFIAQQLVAWVLLSTTLSEDKWTQQTNFGSLTQNKMLQGKKYFAVTSTEIKRTWDRWKKHSKELLWHRSLLLMTILWFALSSPLHPPSPSPVMLQPKEDSFLPILHNIQHCLGWEGRGPQFANNYHWEVPYTFDLHCWSRSELIKVAFDYWDLI